MAARYLVEATTQLCSPGVVAGHLRIRTGTSAGRRYSSKRVPTLLGMKASGNLSARARVARQPVQ